MLLKNGEFIHPGICHFFGLDDAIFAALALSAVATVTSTAGALSQAASNKKMVKAQQREAEMKASRERFAQIRESLAKQAEIQQGAENQGTSTSSSAITGASGVAGRANQNIGFINQQEQYGNQVFQAQSQIANAQGVQALGAGLGKLSGTIFDNRKEIKDIFS